MTLIRLTDPNLAALKRFMRCEHPEARAAHLTEALAAGLGRRTFAALLAEVKSRDLSTAALARFDVGRFETRAKTLGAFDTSAELPTRLAALELPNPCWRVFANRDRAANDAWYRTSRKENLPNVCIRMRRKHAELAWDCISLDTRYEHPTHGRAGAAMGREMFKVFQRRARGFAGKPIYMGSAFVGTVDLADPMLARVLADDFFETLYLATRSLQAAAWPSWLKPTSPRLARLSEVKPLPRRRPSPGRFPGPSPIGPGGASAT